MRRIFVDSAHYIALLNRRDRLHHRAVEAVQALAADPDVRFVSGEHVFVEVLTYQSGFGAEARDATVRLIAALRGDDQLEVVPQTTALFGAGLDLYRRRPDKTYSMVDCMSMALCRERKILDVLTADRDFSQEGFTLLL